MRSVVATNLEEQVAGVTEELHSALLAAGDPLSDCARALQARPSHDWAGASYYLESAWPAVVKALSWYTSISASIGRRCLQWRKHFGQRRAEVSAGAHAWAEQRP